MQASYIYSTRSVDLVVLFLPYVHPDVLQLRKLDSCLIPFRQSQLQEKSHLATSTNNRTNLCYVELPVEDVPPAGGTVSHETQTWACGIKTRL